jgi:hypothetical protein
MRYFSVSSNHVESCMQVSTGMKLVVALGHHWDTTNTIPSFCEIRAVIVRRLPQT